LCRQFAEIADKCNQEEQLSEKVPFERELPVELTLSPYPLQNQIQRARHPSVTPAMEAGIADLVWSIEEMFHLPDAEIREVA
jgi:hypothetical protein